MDIMNWTKILQTVPITYIGIGFTIIVIVRALLFSLIEIHFNDVFQ